MLDKLLLVFKDSVILDVSPNMNSKEYNTETVIPQIDFDMKDIIDFLKSWKSGVNRRFMVKEIQNKFRFGVGFSFINSGQYKNETLLHILVR